MHAAGGILDSILCPPHTAILHVCVATLTGPKRPQHDSDSDPQPIKRRRTGASRPKLLLEDSYHSSQGEPAPAIPTQPISKLCTAKPTGRGSKARKDVPSSLRSPLALFQTSQARAPSPAGPQPRITLSGGSQGPPPPQQQQQQPSQASPCSQGGGSQAQTSASSSPEILAAPPPRPSQQHRPGASQPLPVLPPQQRLLRGKLLLQPPAPPGSNGSSPGEGSQSGAGLRACPAPGAKHPPARAAAAGGAKGGSGPARGASLQAALLGMGEGPRPKAVQLSLQCSGQLGPGPGAAAGSKPGTRTGAGAGAGAGAACSLPSQGSDCPALQGVGVAAGNEGGEVLWADKHRPQSEAQLAVQRKKVAELRKWLEWQLPGNRRSHQPCMLLLTGPPGSGKSAAIQVLAECVGYEVLDWRAPTPTLWDEHRQQGNTDPLGYSPHRSKLDDFEAFVARAKFPALPLHRAPARKDPGCRAAAKMRPRLLVLDDLPHVHDPDQRRRLCGLLRELGSGSRCPVILVATEGEGGGAAGQGGAGGSVAVGGSKGLHKVRGLAVDRAGCG
ncbi:Rad17 cell cycle checkpoint protein-domain-containing protein, partial [Haematococcus lacustris]